MQVRVYLLLSLAAVLQYKKGAWFVAKKLLTKRNKKKKTCKNTAALFLFKSSGLSVQFDSVRALPFSQNTFLLPFSLCCEPCFSKQCRLMKVKVLINVYQPLRTTWQRWQGPHSPLAIQRHTPTHNSRAPACRSAWQ